MKLESVIGLEIHAQISTKTKIFCSSSAEYFGNEPNINIDPVCMGMPGQLPVLNYDALIKGIRTAMALNCELNKYSHFDRKNYFYPDLPKGYQISQYEYPLSQNGYVEISNVDGLPLRVGITRLHLEEDAGKLSHFQGGTLIDFNRAGVGLMEIVSEPDLRSADEAVLYAKAVQQILRFMESSDADMEKGMMRFDASISLRPLGEKKLYPRAEIKNLNSFRSLETAIRFEIARQKKLWENGNPPDRDITVGFDDIAGNTFSMRNKEGSDDYRYFPEPDLPPLILDDDFLNDIRSTLPEMPKARYDRYIKVLGLSDAEAIYLLDDRDIAIFFDKVCLLSGDSKKSASFVLSILAGRLKKDNLNIKNCRIAPDQLAELICMVKEGKTSMNIAKGEVFEEMYSNGKSPLEIIKEKGLASISNLEEIEKICGQVVAENQKIVHDYIGGKENAFKALIGQVMKISRGQANPEITVKILKKLLNKNTNDIS